MLRDLGRGGEAWQPIPRPSDARAHKSSRLIHFRCPIVRGLQTRLRAYAA
jgi:hypothetical protein